MIRDVSNSLPLDKRRKFKTKTYFPGNLFSQTPNSSANEPEAYINEHILMFTSRKLMFIKNILIKTRLQVKIVTFMIDRSCYTNRIVFENLQMEWTQHDRSSLSDFILHCALTRQHAPSIAALTTQCN